MWKTLATVGVTTLVNIAGMSWYASNFVTSTKTRLAIHQDEIRTMKDLDSVRSKALWTTVAKLESVEKKLDGVESLVLNIWDRVK